MGFLIIIIGGINGPLHNSIVAILTPLTPKKFSNIFINTSIKIIIILSFISLLVFLNAEILIRLIGPSLDTETQLIATRQLKILSPCIPFSGFIGLSYGALNARNKFFIR